MVRLDSKDLDDAHEHRTKDQAKSDLNRIIGYYSAVIKRFVDGGFLEHAGDALRLTARGVMVSNEVFQEFLNA